MSCHRPCPQAAQPWGKDRVLALKEISRRRFLGFINHPLLSPFLLLPPAWWCVSNQPLLPGEGKGEKSDTSLRIVLTRGLVGKGFPPLTVNGLFDVLTGGQAEAAVNLTHLAPCHMQTELTQLPGGAANRVL